MKHEAPVALVALTALELATFGGTARAQTTETNVYRGSTGIHQQREDRWYQDRLEALCPPVPSGTIQTQQEVMQVARVVAERAQSVYIDSWRTYRSTEIAEDQAYRVVGQEIQEDGCSEAVIEQAEKLMDNGWEVTG